MINNNKTQQQPQPRNHLIFDPWNSASTGHQRPEPNPYIGSAEWRDTRRKRLAHQFRSGGRQQCDSDSYDVKRGEGEWKWLSAQEAQRKQLGVEDIRRYMGGISKGQKEQKREREQEQEHMKEIKDTKGSNHSHRPLSFGRETPSSYQMFEAGLASTDQHQSQSRSRSQSPTTSHENQTRTQQQQHGQRQIQKHKQGIFSSLTFYINGSTYPIISDLKLKRLLASEGGNISLHLGRRSVTHVILGSCSITTAAASSSGSSSSSSSRGENRGGGLLAGGKLQKEVVLSKSGIKYVSVEWAIESIKTGKKLPEARFSPSSSSTISTASSIVGGNKNKGNDNNNKSKQGLVGAPAGQRSVYEMFNRCTASSSTNKSV